MHFGGTQNGSSICQSVILTVCPLTCQSVGLRPSVRLLFVRARPSVCLSIRQFVVRPPVRPWVDPLFRQPTLARPLTSPSIRTSINSSVRPSVRLVRPSVRLSVFRPSVRPSVHPSVRLYIRSSVRLSARPATRCIKLPAVR